MPTEEILVITTPKGQRQAVVRTPDAACSHRGLLIVLTLDRRKGLEAADLRMVADIALAAGHVVASIDLPRHGLLALPEEEGLRGMAAAMARGEDVFGEFCDTATRLIDVIGADRLSPHGRVAVFGVSRGGLAALHVTARDRRVAACAIHAPVTHLPALKEFAHLADNNLAITSSAEALVDRLADRAVFVSIGQTDPRVDERCCLRFVEMLGKVSKKTPVEFFTRPGETHGKDTFETDRAYHAAAAFLLERMAGIEGDRGDRV